MGLDITVTLKRKLHCPKCGEVVGFQIIEEADSGGRGWYDPLEKIGYYVPYDQRTEENDWYGKDMVLTEEQAKILYDYAMQESTYNGRRCASILRTSGNSDYEIVINADW